MYLHLLCIEMTQVVVFRLHEIQAHVCLCWIIKTIKIAVDDLSNQGISSHDINQMFLEYCDLCKVYQKAKSKVRAQLSTYSNKHFSALKWYR